VLTGLELLLLELSLLELPPTQTRFPDGARRVRLYYHCDWKDRPTSPSCPCRMATQETVIMGHIMSGGWRRVVAS